MRYLLLPAIGFLFLIHAAAQDAKEEKRLFRNYFMSGDEYLYLEDYDEAIFYFSELLKIDPGNYNLNFLLGACYLSKYGEKPKAIPYLEEAVKGISAGYREGSYRERNAPREAFFAMARAYHINNEFDKAITFYERYRNAMVKSSFADIEYVNKQIASCQLARRMLRTPVEARFTPVGEKTEQAGPTYNAVISGTGNRMIYMTDRPFYRAVLMTERGKDGWTRPRVINGEIWSEGNSYPACLSFDGNELYLVKKTGFEGDIYVSVFEGGKWTPMLPLNEEVNTEYLETHASISSDGRKLYFTSDRPGGRGGLDIYVSEREGPGIWGPARNMGSMVNSFYNEETPFISADGSTLFFSSQGHATMGGYDIFTSGRLPDASWSVPRNIGYPVNTTDDDLFYVPRRNKNQALYATILEEQDPGRAIYAVSLGDGSDVQIAVRTEDESELQNRLTGDDRDDGSVDRRAATAQGTTAAQGDESGQVERDPPLAASAEETNPAGGEIPSPASGEIPSPASDEYYVLNSVFFDYDSHTLNDSAVREVERIYEVMKRYPDLRLEVTGHTDARGSAGYNLALSESRANAVKDYLVARGINPDRLIARGVGESAPVALDYLGDGTDSPEGRRLNRHVDLRLHNLNHPNVRVADIFVPGHLRPRQDHSYSVLLLQSDTFSDTIPEVVGGADVSLIIMGSHYLYTAGNYDNRIDAVKLLNHAIDSGYPDAAMLEKRQLEQLVADLIEGEIPPVITFTIQIMALKNPVPVSYFRDLDPVSRFEGNDGLTRYVYGEFTEIDKAFGQLKKVRGLGYQDAFIMYLARYRKQP